MYHQTDGQTYPKIKKESTKAYDRNEASIFIEGLENEPAKIKALLLTSLLMGLRRGEVVALKWEDVDFKNNALSINKSAYKVKGEVQSLKAPKSQNSIRIVYFSETYKKALEEWKREQEQLKTQAGEKWKERGFIFTDDTGGMISVYAPTDICSDYEKRIGLRHLKFHGLRHTCGSLLANNGTDLETIKAVFGHESIRTTEQYLTPYTESKRKAALLMESILNKEKGEDD